MSAYIFSRPFSYIETRNDMKELLKARSGVEGGAGHPIETLIRISSMIFKV
jgi:hypothetical protein